MPYSSDDIRWIRSQLQTRCIGKEFISENVVDSSNELAKQLCLKDAGEGTVVLADSQTRGKGRYGRSWYSEKNVGIYLSIILMPTGLNPEQIPQLALMAGVGLANAVNELSRARAKLKWPNDILINHKKVGGILSELFHEEKKTAPTLILGIGLNVNHTAFPPPLDSIATSLHIENGEPVNRKALVAAVLQQVDRQYQVFLECGIEPIVRDWMAQSEMFENRVQITRGQEILEGTALKLDSAGRLVVLLDNGQEKTFDSGEVTLKC